MAKYGIFLLVLLLSADSSLIAEASSPQISQAQFTQVDQSRGQWTGYIHGAGRIYVGLQILQNGKIAQEHRIGTLSRSSQEKPTSFLFNGAIPTGQWEWKIIAKSLSNTLTGRRIPKSLL
ncbi:MAG: hypothetical protein KDD62_10025 [Bdellovibrionales bacterium]|nr:hypothetical protein [Bdellovibrionales bacterium]